MNSEIRFPSRIITPAMANATLPTRFSDLLNDTNSANIVFDLAFNDAIKLFSWVFFDEDRQ